MGNCVGGGRYQSTAELCRVPRNQVTLLTSLFQCLFWSPLQQGPHNFVPQNEIHDIEGCGLAVVRARRRSSGRRSRLHLSVAWGLLPLSRVRSAIS